jgi:hypothetical protein
MTNGWIDIKNTDMMLIMGGNPAENHPCGFKWPIEAKLHRNAKIISVDPRFTRTSANADIFLQIRAGADIAFLGGLINYAIGNNRIAKDYLTNYTNAAFIIKEGFKLPEDGLYSGFDQSTQVYDKSTWNYEEGGNMTGKAGSTGMAAGLSAETPEQNKAIDEKPIEQPKPQQAGDQPSHQPQQGTHTGQGGTGHGYQAQGPVGAKGTEGPKIPPQLPPNIAYDLSLQHPTLCLSVIEETLFALHARDGGTHYRYTEG